MVCLPDTGLLSASIFTVPLLLVRGLGRRAAHWLVINHQRRLQKLSLRRRHRQSLGQKARRPCSEPLVSRTPQEHDCKIRPRSEPSLAGFREVEVHVSGMHVPVRPFVVICSHPEDSCGRPPGAATPEPPSGGWVRSCLLRVPPVSGPKCSCSQDEAPLLARSSSADGREPVSRQGQGAGAQQQSGSHNISHHQLHGISVGNAKGHPVAGPPIVTAKRPPAPLPAFQNQQPPSTVTHSRQHESSSEGRNFNQNQSVSGSPILNSNRKPVPILPHISGPPAIPPVAAGHPSSQFTEQYPGPQQQARPHEYLKFDEAPQEIAPAVPNASPLLSHQGSNKVVEIKLQDGGTFELQPIFRSLMDQPYFRMISRAKSKDILETADEGMFLIRPSTRSKDPLTLCLRHENRTYNINIRHRRDGRFALGSEKFNELTFTSVEEIVNTHRREPIRLQGGQRAILTDSPPTFGHDYVEISDGLTEAFHHHKSQGVGYGRKM